MLVCYLQYTIIGELIIYCSKSQHSERWRLNCATAMTQLDGDSSSVNSASPQNPRVGLKRNGHAGHFEVLQLGPDT